jgi:hypothetical protein
VTAERDSILEVLGNARKFADPSSPQPVRLMASSGALPLPPVQISTVLFVLSEDPDETVRTRARESLARLPDRVLDPTLEGDVPGALLAQLAELHRDDAGRLEKIALNPATPDATFCFLASLPEPRIVDIVSRNQTRLLRCPALVEALGENPVTSPATLDRVLEFLGLGRSETEETPSHNVIVPEPAPGTAAAGAETFDPNSEDSLPPELLEDDEVDPSSPEAEKKRASLYGRINGMNVMQKIKLARLGNSEARSILIRDRNKLVSSAVIQSPKLTENEVLTYSKNKATPEDVLRIIGNSREWTRSRAIKYALAVHPKTQMPVAMKFLNHLTDLELKNIMKSKDVPGQISIHARRLLSKKGKV